MALGKFVERVIGRLKETPVDLALLSKEGSPGSLLTGAAGVAFFLHEVARLRGEGDLLPLARRWCEAGRQWAGSAQPSQWNDMPFGFMMGEGGLSYVEALLSAGAGDREGAHLAVERIERGAARLNESGAQTRPTELLGGAAGIVCLARDLDARLPPGTEYDASRALLTRARDGAIEMLLARYAAPLTPGPRDYLGFAHGVAGELWALVGALGADHATVRARLAELAALRETDEEGLVYWLPWPGSDATFLLGTWCNGMAGHTLLWCEVARQTRSKDSMELARQCAESVHILLNGAPSICCGHAGHAVALQRYAELSGDAQARKRAYARLVSATRTAEDPEMATFAGLWQGTLGVALVAMGRLTGEGGIAFHEAPNSGMNAP